jgi:uncharacterized protein
MFGLYPGSYEEIQKILAEFDSIEEVIIYGSRAKGTHREGSDIDLVLLGDISEHDLNLLWHKLDDSFIPYKFDISVYSKLNSESLLDHIKRVGKIFYKKK